MSYDNPLTVAYAFPAISFATTPAASAICPPGALRQGRVEEIHLRCSTTFTGGSTTPGEVQLGPAGSLTKYARLKIGPVPPATTPLLPAVTDAYGTRQHPAGILSAGKHIDLSAAGDNVAQVEVTFIAPTGGSLAGVADVTVVMSWW